MSNLLRLIKNVGKKSRPFFQSKSNQRKRSHLQKMMEVAKTFQNLFSSIVKDLYIQRDETHLSKITQDNPVLACIETFSKDASQYSQYQKTYGNNQ